MYRSNDFKENIAYVDYLTPRSGIDLLKSKKEGVYGEVLNIFYMPRIYKDTDILRDFSYKAYDLCSERYVTCLFQEKFLEFCVSKFRKESLRYAPPLRAYKRRLYDLDFSELIPENIYKKSPSGIFVYLNHDSLIIYEDKYKEITRLKKDTSPYFRRINEWQTIAYAGLL